MYKTPLSVVGVEDYDNCMKWAFGEHYSIMLWSNSDNAWNGRHSDIFVMKGCDRVYDSMKMVGLAYLSFGDKFE